MLCKKSFLTKLKRRKMNKKQNDTDPNDEANIKVVVRCRPLNSIEKTECEDIIVQVDKLSKCLIIQDQRYQNYWKPRRFTFDAVYDMKSTQNEVYENSVTEMVNHMLMGFNVTIFAYGQTGAGKTYTMEGNHVEHGILQRAFQQIFYYTEKERRYSSKVQCSYLELYQGKIRDLLDKSSKPLDMKYRPSLPCKGQLSIMCHTIEDMENCRKQGYKSRKTASNIFNDYSSRSHAIFTITLTLSKNGNEICHSKLNLVDLAGSECLRRANASDLRLKECCDINLSLLAVNKVIMSSMKGQSYIPYRDSLLTQLLQDSFGGNSKTLMIANIGPAESTYQETLTTLEYANRAKKIKNRPMYLHQRDQLKRENLAEELERCKLELRMAEACNKELSNKTKKLMKDTCIFLEHLAGL